MGYCGNAYRSVCDAEVGSDVLILLSSSLCLVL